MSVDPRLNDIDDCLYRVAIRVLIIQGDKLLLVQELGEQFWSFPGGGVDHGETADSTLRREVEEELGVPASAVSPDLRIAYYNLGSVVNGVPRMNLFFKASVSEASLQKTSHVAAWGWFTKEQFLQLDLHASYNKAELAEVVFGRHQAR